MYLSSIQQGIQAAHVTAELFMKAHSEEGNMYLLDWANNHKTMILLNAGYSEELRRLIEFFDTKQNPYPWASFNEGQDALDGALTCVGIVLPEKIYKLSSYLRQAPIVGTEEWTEFDRIRLRETTVYEQFLAERIGEYGLAK
jgi:hypothetical protein